MPGGESTGSQMIDSLGKALRIRPAVLAQHMSRDIGNQRRGSGRPDLVRDDLQFLTILGQPEDGLHEIGSIDAIDPAGPHDQMTGTR